MNVRKVNKADSYVQSCFHDFEDELRINGLAGPLSPELEEILWQAASRRADAGYGGMANDGGAREFLYHEVTKLLFLRLGGQSL